MHVKHFVLVAVCLVLSSANVSAQSMNMTFLAQRDDYAGDYSDIWGYVAPGGAEYAIIGSFNGTIFYNVSDPGNPVEVGYIPGPQSWFRDIKVLGGHAYIVTEGEGEGSGLQIVSMADPENPVLVNTWDEKFTDAHNLFIDSTRALAYVCGTDIGMHILDLSDPANPVQTKVLRMLFHYYIHDLYVADDTIWAASGYTPAFRVLANPDSATLVEVASWAYAGALCHSGWLHSDHRYFLSTDETENGHPRIWDVSDKQDIRQISSYMTGTDASIHNVFVRGDLAFISYYVEGVRVLNVRDPYNPVEVGYYDTYAGDGLLDGNWGVYPYLPSGNIIASDIQGGLFILSFDIDVGIGLEASIVPPADGKVRGIRPNPFNPAASIDIFVGQPGVWRLDLYDVRGRLIRTLFDGPLGIEDRTLNWDGTDAGGRPVPSGVYYARLHGSGRGDKKKMVLIR